MKIYPAIIVALAVLLRMVLPAVAEADGDASQIAKVVAKVSPAVVRIIVVPAPKPEDHQSNVANTSSSGPQNTVGSGFIIDRSGFIATNLHVVKDAAELFVKTADGARYPASIVGVPHTVDIALLRINAGHDLPSVSLGDSDKMRVGDTVITIGSPFGFDNSVTSGIISAVNRNILESPFDDYIQTDAAINSGNSGGPVFNLDGEVIGMNSVIFSPSPGFAGLAFAIPSSQLDFVLSRLMKTGEVNTGMLPIYTQRVTWMLEQALHAPSLQGALVSSVQDDDGTMLNGKIKLGDVITTFNGEQVSDPRDLARKAAAAPIGSNATLEIYRMGAKEIVDVTIQRWPETKPAFRGHGSQPKLGLKLESGQDENGQPVVTVAAVDPSGTAADSGIQKGDIIVEIQQTPVSDPAEALHLFALQSSMKQQFAAVLLERDKKRLWIPLAVPE
jgi:serine protease Do